MEKTAIVTGGTGALGRKIVEKFSENGIKVYIPSENLETFNKVFDNSGDSETDNFKLRKIFSFICDATDENSVQEFVTNVLKLENGKIDILINTVGGINPVSEVKNLKTEVLNKMLNLNFMSAFYFSREVLKSMESNRFGRIVSIGAMAGLNPSPGRFDYSISKAGVINLMDTISEEMKKFNIRCNTIIPSVINTAANREWGSEEEIKNWITPEEISEIIIELISDKFNALRSSSVKLYGST